MKRAAAPRNDRAAWDRNRSTSVAAVSSDLRDSKAVWTAVLVSFFAARPTAGRSSFGTPAIFSRRSGQRAVAPEITDADGFERVGIGRGGDG